MFFNDPVLLENVNLKQIFKICNIDIAFNHMTLSLLLIKIVLIINIALTEILKTFLLIYTFVLFILHKNVQVEFIF